MAGQDLDVGTGLHEVVVRLTSSGTLPLAPGALGLARNSQVCWGGGGVKMVKGGEGEGGLGFVGLWQDFWINHEMNP